MMLFEPDILANRPEDFVGFHLFEGLTVASIRWAIDFMHHKPGTMASNPAVRVQSILEYTKNAAAAIDAIAPAAGGTVLTTAAKLSREIITIIEGLQMKANKEQCIRIAENIHHILVALTSVLATSEFTLDIKMLDEIGMFVGTLQKLYGSLRTQQELGKLKRILKQGQISTQLEGYELELSGTLKAFQIHLGTENTLKIAKISTEIGERQEQLLEIIATHTDSSSTISSGGSIITCSSSSILSLLPPYPQIFLGRDKELEHTVRILLSEKARLAILGAGGMGKTTLATAALQHPTVIEKYNYRYFISCESSTTTADLVALVAFQIGLELSQQPSQAIVDHFQHCGSAFILFDNLDTVWEPSAFRVTVEEFISLLADIPHLAIMITMRGSERPGKVKWTRPFLKVLEPISADASRNIFLEIADDPIPGEESAFSELLELADNLPLAINLLAHLVACESYSTVLSRWKIENVNLLSTGFDKGSSLDESIKLSLASPRMVNTPEALDLLALISLLPDGIQDDDLEKARLPIAALAECKTTLIRTSLVHTTPDKRVKVLTPIREFMQINHPAPVALAQPLQKYFQDLVFLWEKYRNNALAGTLTPHLNMNTANVHSLLLNSLQHKHGFELQDLGHTIFAFDFFLHKMLKGNSPLVEYIPMLIESTGNRDLYWDYFGWLVRFQKNMPTTKDVDVLLAEAIQYFVEHNQMEKQVRFYAHVAEYHRHRNNFVKALELSDLSISLIHSGGLQITPEHLHALNVRAAIERNLGNYLKCLHYAQLSSQLSARLGQISYECIGLQEMSSACFRLGNLTKALQHCAKIQKLMLLIGMERSSEDVVIAFDLEASIHFEKTEYRETYRCLESILEMSSPRKMPFFHANSHLGLAELGLILGRDGAEINSHLAAGRAVSTQLSWKGSLLRCEQICATLDLVAGYKTRALITLKGLLGKSRKDPDQMLCCLEVLGDSRKELFGLQETFHWTVTYFALAAKVRYLGHIYNSLRCLGDILWMQDDEESALQIFYAVLAGATEMDVHRYRGDCMARIGDIMDNRGEKAEARVLWEQARPLFIASSQMKDATEMDERLSRQRREIQSVSELLE